jgi:hypothetical protein
MHGPGMDVNLDDATPANTDHQSSLAIKTNALKMRTGEYVYALLELGS